MSCAFLGSSFNNGGSNIVLKEAAAASSSMFREVRLNPALPESCESQLLMRAVRNALLDVNYPDHYWPLFLYSSQISALATADLAGVCFFKSR